MFAIIFAMQRRHLLHLQAYMCDFNIIQILVNMSAMLRWHMLHLQAYLTIMIIIITIIRIIIMVCDPEPEVVYLRLAHWDLTGTFVKVKIQLQNPREKNFGKLLYPSGGREAQARKVVLWKKTPRRKAAIFK